MLAKQVMAKKIQVSIERLPFLGELLACVMVGTL